MQPIFALALQIIAHEPVVRTEIPAPAGDGVSFVHHEQAQSAAAQQVSSEVVSSISGAMYRMDFSPLWMAFRRSSRSSWDTLELRKVAQCTPRLPAG